MGWIATNFLENGTSGPIKLAPLYIQMPRERVVRVLAKIVKGVRFHQTNILLRDATTRWQASDVTDMPPDLDGAAEEFQVGDIYIRWARWLPQSRVHTASRALRMQVKEKREDFGLIYFLHFYTGVVTCVVATPSTWYLNNRVARAYRLTWPGPTGEGVTSRSAHFGPPHRKWWKDGERDPIKLRTALPAAMGALPKPPSDDES
jgi:hypothetical protein